MNDWKQTQFGKEYDAFRQELDDYYAAYPTDVSALEQELDEKSRLQPQAGAMEKKTWIYELAAEKCRVKLFRHCPFYFEVDTGAPRNLAGSCFPPIPGLGSWLMRRDTSGLEQEFQNWIAPYVQEDALNSTMYVTARTTRWASATCCAMVCADCSGRRRHACRRRRTWKSRHFCAA